MSFFVAIRRPKRAKSTPFRAFIGFSCSNVNTARQGEIVVALVHGSETTLKRFFPEGAVVRLQPSNVEMDPIYVPATQVAIQGRVLGVLRKYR